ncbi:MAG: DsrE family protein [Promethearchaeota archaeon]
MKNERMILYVQTTDVPERQYSPLVLARAAKAMDLEPKLYYLGIALRVLRPGVAEKIKLGGFPSVGEILRETLDMGIEIFACDASKRMFGWDSVELVPGVQVVGATTLNDFMLDAGGTMWF